MLYLSRKLGQSVIIDNEVEVTILAVEGKKVKLGIKSVGKHQILREEVFAKIKQANIEAATGAADAWFATEEEEKP